MQPVYTQTNYLNQYLTPQQVQFQQNKYVVHEQLRNRGYIQPTVSSQRTVITQSQPMTFTRTVSNQSTLVHPHAVPQPMMRQVIQQQQPTMVMSHQSPVMQLPPPIFQTQQQQTIVHNHQVPQTQTIVQHQFPQQFQQPLPQPLPLPLPQLLPQLIPQQLPPFIPPTVLKQETVTIFEPRKEKDPPYLSMSCDGNRTTVDPVKGKFTEYKLIVETNIEEYMIENTQWKRYSDFEELHQIITQSYRHIVLPAMPSKHYFTQFDETVIRDRERAFDKMLNILCTDHSNTALINFLQKDV
jgi:hypothetical protein